MDRAFSMTFAELTILREIDPWPLAKMTGCAQPVDKPKGFTIEGFAKP